MLDLVYQNLTEDKSFKEDFFIGILNLAIEELKLGDKNIEISINLVDEQKIRELNKKHRSKDKATDILSFPMTEKMETCLSGRRAGNWKMETIDLGDIFICLPFAKKQAKLENVSIEKKIAQLAVHGFLHLLGHDHPNDEVSGPRLKRRGDKMFKLENKILEKWQSHI